MNDPSVTVSEFEESPGVISMMRKMVQKAVRTGQAMIGLGTLLSAGMLAAGRYELVPIATALVIGGPSLIGGALGFKAWQAQAEGRTGGSS